MVFTFCVAYFPIELQGDANLTLVVDGTFTVTGGAAGNGQDGPATTAWLDATLGGTGGFAGIAVPIGTTLTVRGSGSVYAYGGHAGYGGDGKSDKGIDNGAAGGGGAGAGIGGNGGRGGDGNYRPSNGAIRYAESSGKNGSNGISAGTIGVYETVTVSAYGGAGGSGGDGAGSTPGGGGGYPAAGIGGGGAGGGGASHGPSGAGFTGGRGERDSGWGTGKTVNGLTGGTCEHGPGGGYFLANNGTWGTARQGQIGGIGYKYNADNYDQTEGGSGGTSGSGGAVQVGSNAVLQAYNGSYITASLQKWGLNPTPIYAQSGYDLELLRKAGVTKVDAGLTKNGVRSKEELEKELGATGKSSTIKATGLAGVGSGAGATEASNGTFAVLNVPGKTVLSSVSVPQKGQLKIDWTAPSAGDSPITGYYIYVDDVKQANPVTGTTTTLTGLDPSKSYKIQVAAYSIVGEGEKSDATSKYPRTLPGKVQNLTGAMVNGTQIDLTWNAPTDDGITNNNPGTAIDGYVVTTYLQNGTQVGATGKTVTGTSASMDGLTPGTWYYFEVAAKNAEGTGEVVKTINILTAKAPAKADTLTATPTNRNGEVKITWDRPNNGNATITEYRLYDDITKYEADKAKGYTDNSLTKLVQAASGQAKWEKTLDGYTNGETYTFYLVSKNVAGWSEVATASATPRMAPDAPDKVEAKATGVREITVTWDIPEDNGNDIKNYLIEWTLQNGSGSQQRTVAASDVTILEGGTKASYVIGGPSDTHVFADDTTYVFSVAAENDAGMGSSHSSGDFSIAKTWGKPAAPSYVEATPDSSGQVTVSWSAAVSNNTPVTRYTIYIYENVNDANAATNPYNTVPIDSGSARSEVISGLEKGKPWYFRVSATNAVGEGAKTVLCSSIPQGPPTAPGNIVAEVLNDTSVKVTWNPAYYNGSDITGYEFNVLNESNGVITTANYTTPALKEETIDGEVHKYYETTVTNLTPYTTYKFQARAINHSDPSNEDLPTPGVWAQTELVTTMRVPFPVANLKVVPTGNNGELRITWDEPVAPYAKPGVGLGVGTPVEYYDVYLNGSSAPHRSNVKTRDIYMSGFTNGTPVKVLVVAHNAIGDGEHTTAIWEANAVEGTPFGQSAAPTDVIATIAFPSGSETGNVNLSWTAPTATGGKDIVKYGVKVHNLTDDDITGMVTVTYPTDRKETSAVISGLEQGQTYSFEVAADNGNEESGEKFSDYARSNTVVMWEVPSKPQYVTAVPTHRNGEILITWEKPSNNGNLVEDTVVPENNTDVTGYSLYWRIKDGNGNWSMAGPWRVENLEQVPDRENTYRFFKSGLKNGEEYEFAVAAENGAGLGDKSLNAEGKGVFAKPDMPPEAPVISGEVVSGDHAGIIPTITAPDENGSLPITGYNLYAREENSDVWVLKGTYNATSEILPGSKINDVKVPGLTPARNYYVAVSAVNAASNDGGEKSNELFVRPGKPFTPENLKVELAPNMSIRVKYDDANDNGCPIDYYNVYVTSGNKEVVKKVTGTDNIVPVEIDNGESVSVRVSAVNAAAESEKTESQSVTVGAPTTPEITAFEFNSSGVSFSWTESQGNGNKMRHYNIYLNGEVFRTVDASAAENGIVSTIINKADGDKVNLVAGQSYKVEVSAENLAGESPKSAPREFKFGVPPAPTLTGVTFKASALVASWTAPIINEGEGISPVTGYRVFLNGEDSGLELTIGSPELIETTKTTEDGKTYIEYSAEIPNLANGVSYKVQIAAVNEWGVGSLSGSSAQTPATQAAAPRDIVAAATSDTAAKLTWLAPVYNGGAPILGYKITVLDEEGQAIADNQGGYPDSNITITPGGDKATNATISGLVSGNRYSFQVQAVTKANEGEIGTSNPILTFTKPDAPTITEKTSVGSGTGRDWLLSVKWEPPTDNGGADITGYIIYIDGEPENENNPISDTTYSVQGMSYGRSCRIEVAAVNAAGLEGKRSEAAFYTVGTAPVPVITSVTAGVDDVDISWESMADQNIAGYYVYSVDASGNESRTMTLIGANHDTVNLNRLREGRVYRYCIRAFNDLGIGDSSKICEIVVGAPGATNVDTLAPNGKRTLEVTWTKPSVPTAVNSADQEKYNVKGYEIFVDGVKYQDAPADATSASVTGLEGGKEYKVEVRAYSFVGQTDGTTRSVGAFGTAKTATPWSEPDRPVITSIIPGDKSFTVNFKDGADNGSPIVKRYVYAARVNNDGSMPELKNFVQVAETNDTGSVIVNKDILNGKPGYRVFMIAESSYATSTSPEVVSDETTVGVIPGIPGAPRITSLVPGDGEVTIAYTTPTVAGAELKDYQISYYEYTGNLEADTVTKTVTGNSDVITGLENRKTYAFYVRAQNTELEYGPASETMMVTVGTPEAPVITESTSGNGIAKLKWRVPESPVEHVTIYKIYADGNFVQESSVPYATVEGLENGTPYLLQVSAVNTCGESRKSDVALVTPGTVPDAPQNVKAEATGGSQIKITWDVPETDGGFPISGYLVEGNGVTTNNVDYKGTTATVSGLKEGTSYSFTVKAVNNAGNSVAAETESVTTFTKPSAPLWASTNSANENINIEWYAPENNGGTEIIGYNVYFEGVKINDELIEVTDVNFNPDEGTVFYTIENREIDDDGNKMIVNGQKYKIAISAVNIVGEGQLSSAMSVTASGKQEASVPGAPSGVTAVAGDKSAVVSWRAPSFDGNSPITGYEIWVDGEQEPRVVVNDPTRLSWTVTGLENGTSYEFYVRARNVKGTGAASKHADPVMPFLLAAPGKPENVGYYNNSTMNRMTIFWQPPTANINDNDLRYNVYIDSGNGNGLVLEASGLDELTYEKVGVNTNALYTIYVEAYNEGGATRSDLIRARANLNVMSQNIEVDTAIDANFDGEEDNPTEIKAPSEPTNLHLQLNGANRTITLTWGEPADIGAPSASGVKIVAYDVYMNGTKVATVDANDGLTYTFNDVANGAYTFGVSAISEDLDHFRRQGAQATRATLVSVSALAAPTNLTAKLETSGSDVLGVVTWDAPEGVENIHHYNVYINGIKAGKVDSPATTYSWRTDKNKIYTISVSTVMSEDDSQESRQCDPVDVRTTIEKPTVPTGLQITEPNNELKVTLSWNASENMNDPEVNYYQLYVNGVATGGHIAHDATSIELQLASNTDYTYQLEAVAELNEDDSTIQKFSGKSEAVFVSTKAKEAGAPDTPVLNDVEINGKNATVTWDAVAVPDGADKVIYKIYINGVAEVTYDPTESVELVNYLDEITEPGSEEVAAGNSTSAESTEPVADETGTTPEEVVGDDVVADEVTTPAANHIVIGEPTSDADALSPLLDNPTAGAELSYTVTLDAGTDDFTFQVSAVAVTGTDEVEGLKSNTITRTTKVTMEKPGKPTNLKAELVGEGEGAYIHVTWTAPTENVDALDHYTVVINGTPVNVAKDTTSYDFTGVSESITTYTVYVGAVNGEGEPTRSDLVVVSTSSNEPQPDIAGPPTITGSASDGTSRISVFWDAPTENAEGITGYTVTKDGAKVTFAADTMILVDGTWVKLNTETDTLPETATGVLFTDVELGRHPVIVTAVKARTINGTPIVWTGQASNTWNINLSTNIDTTIDPDNKDEIPTKPTESIDTTGNGMADSNGKTVRFTGTVESGSTGEAAVVKVLDQYGVEVATATATDENTYEADVTVDGTVAAALADGEGLLGYTVVVTQKFCTSYTIEGITFDIAAENVDLGSAKLYVGDLDGNGRINALDKNAITKNMNKMASDTIIGDLDGNGRINALDMNVVTKNMYKGSTTVQYQVTK